MINSKDQSYYLRAIEKEDLTLIQSWRNSEYFRQFFREYRELSMANISQWYNSTINDNRFQMFCITEAKSSIVMGVAGITYIDFINRHGDVHFYIGYKDEWIDDKCAKSIFPTLIDYGFNTLNLNKLWAEVFAIDKKKIAFFSSQGFHRDGILREHYYHEGNYVDSHIYSLIK